ncbi:hypothetical protein [Mucilaginibacter sp. L3T2-6]|uniref:hypothetical protein n=1 Tax=Mucilaginibacter sp. L3T2-6 TaxID=3062491 RepID=UPI0026752AF8|nr:hypothetical protein [Mucilaginibacter sp. L3T2-6]MDO3644063.1 hypothetical protein [Mucilaginibacter sp. L3T2-6]MDV6216514.1 hypothetical protein [Mucilaginibacter sp. L3T2-6]
MNCKQSLNLLMLSCVMLLAACSDDSKPKTTLPAVPARPALMPPFRFHKLVEVSPGQDYDVVSWGRGAKTAGAFAILHSDSSAVKFTTTTGDLDGEIVDAYNSDMDLDGNPEILIQAKGRDTINYANIYAFEFNGSNAHKLDFPKLTKSQRTGYRGDDNFYIKDGKLIREFPIYDGNSKAAKPTGAKRQFEYGLRNNEFTIKQLSKDSTDKKSATATANQPAKSNNSSKKEESSSKKETTSKKSKKHTEETSHKKKKRKHRSGE